MKRIFCLLPCLLFVLSSMSVPTDITITHRQSDGTILTARLFGDEFCHVWLTDDDLLILREDNSDDFFYAVADAEKNIVVSTHLAHNCNMRQISERHFVEKNCRDILTLALKGWSTRMIERTETKVSNVRSIGQSHHLPERKYTYEGTKRGLVILVNFTNTKMTGYSPQYNFNRRFNEVGFSDDGHIGSVSDYFRDQSYGAFNLVFDVVGPVTVSQKDLYYGANDKSGNDKRPAEMIIEACRLVDSGVNFRNYDWNGDGEVENVFVIYAGYAESEGASESTIWPHKWSLSSAAKYGEGEGALLLDGVVIDTYACASELSGNSGTNINGIGTACHEFSHCLGLSDVYDTDYSGGFGMKNWDVMDSGSRNGPTSTGEIPCGYSAFERYMCGWLTPIELNSECHIEDMPSLGDEPVAYVVCNEANPDEMLMLENRQSERWFQYVNNYTDIHGMLVTHIDYDQEVWQKNDVNVYADHQRMTIVPAGGYYARSYSSGGKIYYSVTEEDYASHLFPGSQNITALTAFSHYDVGGRTFTQNVDGAYTFNVPIDLIKEKNGRISFDVMRYFEVAVPYDIMGTNIRDNAFDIVWSCDMAVDSCQVRIVSVPEQTGDLLDMIPHTYYFTTYTSRCELSSLKYSQYSVAVRAYVGERISKWSEPVVIATLRDGIDDISSISSVSTGYMLNGIYAPRSFPYPACRIINGKLILGE